MDLMDKIPLPTFNHNFRRFHLENQEALKEMVESSKDHLKMKGEVVNIIYDHSKSL